MKRQIFAVIAVILSLALSVAALAGCFGSVNDIPVDPGQERPNQPDNPDKPVDPDQPEEGTFAAHVVVDSGEDKDGTEKTISFLSVRRMRNYTWSGAILRSARQRPPK